MNVRAHVAIRSEIDHPRSMLRRAARAAFERHFPPGRQHVLAGIRVADCGRTRNCVDVVRGDGVDGVLLINHGIGHQRLLRLAQRVADAHPGWFVGVNSRDLRPQDVIHRLSPGVQGVWADEADGLHLQPPAVRAICEARQECRFEGLLFGSILPLLDRDQRVPCSDGVADVNAYDVLTLGTTLSAASLTSTAVLDLHTDLGAWPLAVVIDLESTVDARALPHADCLIALIDDNTACSQPQSGWRRRLALLARQRGCPLAGT